MSNVLMQEIPPGKKKVEEIQANDSFHPNLLLLMGRVRLILYAIFFSRENISPLTLEGRIIRC